MTNIRFSAAEIRQQSARVTEMADDLRSVKQAWLAGTGDAASALGLGDLVTAFDSMRQAWAEQYDVYIDLVSELGHHLGATADTYDRAEASNAEHVRSVGR